MVHGPWWVVKEQAEKGLVWSQNASLNPWGPVGDTNTNNLPSGLDLGQEGGKRRRRNSNTSPLRNGGKDGGCRCTNRYFANKMVMDAMVRVGDGGGVCPVTKANLVVVDHCSCGNSTINPSGRGNTSELTIQSSA